MHQGTLVRYEGPATDMLSPGDRGTIVEVDAEDHEAPYMIEWYRPNHPGGWITLWGGSCYAVAIDDVCEIPL